MDIGDRILETAVGGDFSNAVVGSGANVTNREENSNHKNRTRSENFRCFQSVLQAVGMAINKDSENSELFSDSELDFRIRALVKVADWTSNHYKGCCNN